MRIKTITRAEYQQHINILAEYINSHLDEDVDLNGLAGIFGLSRWYFHRIFAEFLRESAGALIIRMRVETAARLLCYTEIPVKGIAYKVGRDVPSFLSRISRQSCGISSNEHRNNKGCVIMELNRIVSDIELEIEVKDLPGKRIIYVRLSRGYKEVDYPGVWTRLLRFAGKQNVQPLSSSPICLCRGDPRVTSPDKLRIGIYMEVAPAVCPEGEIGTKKVLEGRFMVALYKETYQQLEAVYDTLCDEHLPEMGLSLREAPNGEVYSNDPCGTGSKDLLTQIYVMME